VSTDTLPEIPGGFCSLCGSTNPADLGVTIGICLDATACHQRQCRKLRDRAEHAEDVVAEVRETVATFLAHYEHSELPSFRVAQDLAQEVLQVVDRDKISGEEETDHG
jgi:hypothetical protein